MLFGQADYLSLGAVSVVPVGGGSGVPPTLSASTSRAS